MGKDHAAPILQGYKPKPPGAGRDAKRAVAALAVGAAALGGLWLALGARPGGAISGWTEATASIGPIDEVIQVSGSVEMKRSRAVLSPEAGTLTRRIAEPGDWVTPAVVLGRVEAPELDDSLAKALGDIATAGRELAVLDSNRGFALEREQIDGAKKLRAVEDARAALARARELEAAGTGTAKEVADRNRALLEAEEAFALAELSRRETAQSYAFQRAALLDKIDTLNATRASLESRIAALQLKSPLSGRLLSWRAAEGDVVARNAALATVADTGEPEAVFSLPEASASRVGPGMKISVSVGGTAYPGTVVSVGRETAASSDLGTTVQLVASFDGPTPEFASGATASGEILVASKPAATLLPRGPYLSSGGSRAVYVIEGEYAVKRAVSFGASRGGFVEALSGIEAGERIITSDYREFIDKDRVRLGGAK